MPSINTEFNYKYNEGKIAYTKVSHSDFIISAKCARLLFVGVQYFPSITKQLIAGVDCRSLDTPFHDLVGY